MDLLTACILLLVTAYLIFYFTKRNGQLPRRIPGPQPSDPEEGNNKDMGKAGGLFQYVVQLHQQYGAIVAFWLGKQQVVSLTCQKGFKETRNLFDKPHELLVSFQPLFGNEGVFFANGARGQELRRRHDHAFSHSNVIKRIDLFKKLASDLCGNLTVSCKDAKFKLPIKETFMTLALQTIINFCFGDDRRDTESCQRFKSHYEKALKEIDKVQAAGCTDGSTPDAKDIDTHVDALVTYLQSAIEEHRDQAVDTGMLIDIILQLAPSDEWACREALTYIIAGFHSTALLLTWSLYFLSMHKSMQEKAHEELQEVLDGLGQNIDVSKLEGLVYLRQILDETLRCSGFAPAAVRVADEDINVDGYVIPAKTPIMQELAISHNDETLWENPSTFDPERFDPEKRQNFARFAFEPFGFAGKRKCPGYRLVYCETAVFLANLLLNFEFSLEEDSDISVRRDFGFVGSPAEEIWVTLKPRFH